VVPCNFFLFNPVKKSSQKIESLWRTRFNNRKEVNGKIEDGSDGYTDNRNVSRAGSSAGISALQSIGSTLKGTISLLMNNTCILNFLNEFRELFDQIFQGELSVGLSEMRSITGTSSLDSDIFGTNESF